LAIRGPAAGVAFTWFPNSVWEPTAETPFRIGTLTAETEFPGLRSQTEFGNELLARLTDSEGCASHGCQLGKKTGIGGKNQFGCIVRRSQARAQVRRTG
jgi:hypothetical protein